MMGMEDDPFLFGMQAYFLGAMSVQFPGTCTPLEVQETTLNKVAMIP